MSDISNSNFGPPPLQTDINGAGPDEHGVAFQNRVAQGGVASGHLNQAWSAWFTALYARLSSIAGITLGPIYTVPIVAGVATPDLSQGPNQLVLMTADTQIAAPINATVSQGWSLITRQDNVGGHSALFDASYFFKGQSGGSPQSPASTQCQANWIFDFSSGHSSLNGSPSIDQPIP